MQKLKLALAAAAAAVFGWVGAVPASAAEEVDFVLNWYPGADHAPYFYALDQGWYKDAGLEVEIQTGKGSGASSQQVAAGQADLGIADLPTAMIARSQGGDLKALMAIYANSPQGFYWRKSSGIAGPQDFPGRSIGNPPADASRVMWPAFAQAAGIPVDSVKFVNVAPQAKLPALMSGQIDIMSDFYNGHDLKIREIGDDMGYISWRELGVNPHGNTIIVNGAFLEKNPETVAKFIAVTQKAFRACADEPAPCIDALLANASGLDRPTQEDQWNRVIELMTTEATQNIALGYLEPERMASDYALVETYFELKEPFDINEFYTNDFLSKEVKVPARGN